MPETTKQYLAGTVLIDEYYVTEGSMHVPITVSFDRGDGSVIYTSVHYEAQESEVVQTLMEYLVFKAVTETITFEIVEDLTDEGFNIAYDIRDGIDEGETKIYDVEIDDTGKAKVVLDWHGDTITLSINLQTPEGDTIESTGTKQKYIVINNASMGTYQINVIGDDVSTDNEPFTLAVGTGGVPSDDDDSDDDSTSTTSPGTPGFELLTMLVALAIALILLKKKK